MSITNNCYVVQHVLIVYKRFMILLNLTIFVWFIYHTFEIFIHILVETGKHKLYTISCLQNINSGQTDVGTSCSRASTDSPFLGTDSD